MACRLAAPRSHRTDSYCSVAIVAWLLITKAVGNAFRMIGTLSFSSRACFLVSIRVLGGDNHVSEMRLDGLKPNWFPLLVTHDFGGYTVIQLNLSSLICRDKVAQSSLLKLAYYTLKTNPPVLGNAIPVLGVKPKRGWYVFRSFFKMGLCLAISFKRSRWELSIDVAGHRSILKNKGIVRILAIFQDGPMFSHIIQKVSARAFHWCGWT